MPTEALVLKRGSQPAGTSAFDTPAARASPTSRPPSSCCYPENQPIDVPNRTRHLVSHCPAVSASTDAALSPRHLKYSTTPPYAHSAAFSARHVLAATPA